MPTIDEIRAALGDVAVGKTDAEIEQLRDRFMTFARALVGVSAGKTLADLRVPSVGSSR